MKKINFLPFLIFFISGIGILFYGLSALKLSYDAKSWPTTNGKVISSAVKSYWRSSHSRRHRTTTRMYSANVEYQYKVNSQTYNSGKVSFGEYSSSNPMDAQKVVDKYPPNMEVLVYYNPKKLELAILEPGKVGGIYIPFLVGGVFTLISLMLLKIGLKANRIQAQS